MAKNTTPPRKTQSRQVAQSNDSPKTRPKAKRRTDSTTAPDSANAARPADTSPVRKRSRHKPSATSVLPKNGLAGSGAEQATAKSANPAATQKGVKGFLPGKSGNPGGRPTGSRNKATVLAESLLDGESEELMRALIEKAKSGDWAALKLVIEHLCQKQRPRPDAYELPAVETAEDIRTVTSDVIQAVSNGDLSPETAVIVTRLLDLQLKTISMGDLVERLETLIEGREKIGCA